MELERLETLDREDERRVVRRFWMGFVVRPSIAWHYRWGWELSF